MILLFLDSESTGLDPVIHVPWEVAAVRAEHTDDGRLVVLGSYEAMIGLSPYQHATADPVALDVGRFHERHRVRADGNSRPRSIGRVAREIDDLCDDKPLLVGANPNFDERMVGDLLRRCGVSPRWYYRSIDVTTLVVGHLTGFLDGQSLGRTDTARENMWRARQAPPKWKSDDISRSVGVDPEKFDRHTAMGDVRWCMAQYARVFALQIVEAEEVPT
jgi:hypothetical protein